MIIECPYCESKVDGKMIGEHKTYCEEEGVPFKVLLLECPVCKESLVGCQSEVQTDSDKYEWVGGTRLWPQPKDDINWIIPNIVRKSLDEALKCFNAKAYSACAVMCGKALEGVCKINNPKSKYLGNGLKELLENKIIDERLFKWGETLREHRNLGAHATEENISKEDAKDLLEFVNAICEYIYVLTDKYNKFMDRKHKKEVKPKKG